MLFAFLRPFLTVFLRVFYPYKIYGKENIDQSGNTVVICNHFAKMDVPMVGYLFKGKTYYLAKKEWFKNKLLGWIFKKLGGIPVDRDNIDMECIKTSLRVLKDGKRLCVFPEGTRNRTDTREIQQLHGGAGIFAFKTKAKIIPINIHQKSRFLHKNYLYVGKAFDFSEYYGRKADAELNELLTRKMYDEMCGAQKQLDEILRREAALKTEKKQKNK